MPRYDSPPYNTTNPVTANYNNKECDHGIPPVLSRPGNSDALAPSIPAIMYNPFFTGTRSTQDISHGYTSPIDRQHIIRKIKTVSKSPSPPPLLLSSDLDGSERSDAPSESLDQNAVGLEISRPRSALHRGDFREETTPSPWLLDSRNDDRDRRGSLSPPRKWQAPLSTSPVVPWHRDFPQTALGRHSVEPDSLPPTSSATDVPARSRALSHTSLSTSFTYQPPTSPLVYQANAADIPDNDLHRSRRHRQSSPNATSRRHTYSPHLLRQSRSALEYLGAPNLVIPSHAASLRRESTFPYQAHQPRRSVGSFNSLPQSPYTTSRRPSISEASPLQHAPMVGSYEESILRGRMSTTPSKPLNFVAQIGVLGKGDCKPNLRCPPHVIIPFPAVFYSYSSALAVDPEPSPYVGMIDLENTLQKPAPRDGSRKRRRHRSPHDARQGPTSGAIGAQDNLSTPSRRRKNDQSRASSSLKEPLGGCYRIPQRGQLQIVLKNPNKTAVKLFLVPYDLSDMEPGQKTFIRQRSYSAGPIIDMPVTSRNNYGTDRPEAAISAAHDPKDRPILRYLIHLHICCPSRNRYYLYQNIRVVFANRVPDGKEKLRSEIQMPEPRYSAYKPGRDCNSGFSPVVPDTARHHHRRSAVYPLTSTNASSLQSQQRDEASSVDSRTNTFSNDQLFVKSLNNNSNAHFKFPASMHHILPHMDHRSPIHGLGSSNHEDNMEIDDDDDDLGHEPQSNGSPRLASANRPMGLRIRNLSSEFDSNGNGNSNNSTCSRHDHRSGGSGGKRRMLRDGSSSSSSSFAGSGSGSLESTMTFSREASRERTRMESLLSRRLKDLEMRGEGRGRGGRGVGEGDGSGCGGVGAGADADAVDAGKDKGSSPSSS